MNENSKLINVTEIILEERYKDLIERLSEILKTQDDIKALQFISEIYSVILRREIYLMYPFASPIAVEALIMLLIEYSTACDKAGVQDELLIEYANSLSSMIINVIHKVTNGERKSGNLDKD